MANDDSTLQMGRLCSLPPEAPPVYRSDLDPNRLSAIVLLANKWVNGTAIHYWFFDETDETQKNVVRKAFAYWQERVGLSLVETPVQARAELRIGFDHSPGQGSWSYVGTYNLTRPKQERTMNFGWDLKTDWGWATALHEIGHALGMPHEHQNPLSGIVWDEDAVYREFTQTQGWGRDKIFYNIIRKIPTNEVAGTTWDPKSIMHYSFRPGLIKAPPPFDTKGISPNYVPSPQDLVFISELYPRDSRAPIALSAMSLVRLTAKRGEQQDFLIEPTDTRYYDIQTVGKSDAKMILFELRNEERVYLSGDDDSGHESNAKLRVRLFSGGRYILSVRLHYVEHSDGVGVILI